MEILRSEILNKFNVLFIRIQSEHILLIKCEVVYHYSEFCIVQLNHYLHVSCDSQTFQYTNSKNNSIARGGNIINRQVNGHILILYI